MATGSVTTRFDLQDGLDPFTQDDPGHAQQQEDRRRIGRGNDGAKQEAGYPIDPH